jgi:hypothetical protein
MGPGVPRPRYVPTERDQATSDDSDLPTSPPRVPRRQSHSRKPAIPQGLDVEARTLRGSGTSLVPEDGTDGHLVRELDSNSTKRIRRTGRVDTSESDVAKISNVTQADGADLDDAPGRDADDACKSRGRSSPSVEPERAKESGRASKSTGSLSPRHSSRYILPQGLESTPRKGSDHVLPRRMSESPAVGADGREGLRHAAGQSDHSGAPNCIERCQRDSDGVIYGNEHRMLSAGVSSISLASVSLVSARYEYGPDLLCQRSPWPSHGFASFVKLSRVPSDVLRRGARRLSMLTCRHLRGQVKLATPGIM